MKIQIKEITIRELTDGDEGNKEKGTADIPHIVNKHKKQKTKDSK